MQPNVTSKKINFILVSIGVATLLFVSAYLGVASMYIYTAVLSGICAGLLIWSLELFPYKRLWLFALVLPLHLAVGGALSLFQYPNLSFYFKAIFLVGIAVLFYICLLVINIFTVIESRGKMIPLYRAASTWAQILIVVASILFYSAVFKIPAHPLIQAGVVVVSAYLLLDFWSRVLKLEVEVYDASLVLVGTFWVSLFAFTMLFIPFEALFRGLFLSSVVLFGLGFIQNYLKHTLTRRIILEHVVITVLFLLMGLLFIP